MMTESGVSLSAFVRSSSTASTGSAWSSNTRRRPRRISMAGMIYDANRLLERAMDPKRSGLHPNLFDDSLLGIGFYTVLEAGFIVSGNIGTGIVMARNPTNGAWSAPAAVGLSGIGAGLMGGANMKSLLYLIYDYYTLDAMSGENGVMLSSQAGASIGSWGRTAEASTIMSAKGRGTNIALAYSHGGIFAGLSVEGAFSKGRTRVNEKFYGRKGVTTSHILFSGEKLLATPTEEETLLPELYGKLERLRMGLPVYEPTVEEKIKKEATLRRVAREESKLKRGGDDSFLLDNDDDASSTEGNLIDASQSSLLNSMARWESMAKGDPNDYDYDDAAAAADDDHTDDDSSTGGKQFQPTSTNDVSLLSLSQKSEMTEKSTSSSSSSPTNRKEEGVMLKGQNGTTTTAANHPTQQQQHNADKSNNNFMDGDERVVEEAIECCLKNLQCTAVSLENTSISTTVTSSSSFSSTKQQQQSHHLIPYDDDVVDDPTIAEA